MKVKIFASFYEKDVESEVNQWLESNAGKTAQVTAISHAVSDRYVTVMITYTPLV